NRYLPVLIIYQAHIIKVTSYLLIVIGLSEYFIGLYMKIKRLGVIAQVKTNLSHLLQTIAYRSQVFLGNGLAVHFFQQQKSGIRELFAQALGVQQFGAVVFLRHRNNR